MVLKINKTQLERQIKNKMNNHKVVIIENLKSCKNTIHLQIAWFTDSDIINILEELATSGKVIKVIISSNNWNFISYKHFLRLVEKFENIEIRRYGSENSVDGNFMHNKLCIIDKHIIINGSYNYTKNTTKNIESITIENNIEKGLELINIFENYWMKSIPVSESDIEGKTVLIERLNELELKGINPEMSSNKEIIDSMNIEDKSKLPQKLEKIHNLQRSESGVNKGLIKFNEDFGLTNQDFELFDIKNISSPYFVNLIFKFNGQNKNVIIRKNELRELLLTNRQFSLIDNICNGLPLILISFVANGITFKNPIYIEKKKDRFGREDSYMIVNDETKIDFKYSYLTYTNEKYFGQLLHGEITYKQFASIFDTIKI